jgi:DNA-binding response OmpR family regulator
MQPLSHKVLIVDDNQVNRLICSELLEEHYDLEFAVDGEDAIQKATEFDPDLVLLDVMMPGIDGLEVCRRLRKSSRPWVKIILVSAKVQTSDRLAGYEAGADDYVGKPFDEDELLAKIRVHLKLKRTEEVDELKYNVLRAMQHGNRTPITKILCRSEMLMGRKSELSEECLRDAEYIIKATKSLHHWLRSAQVLIELKSEMIEFEVEPVEVESLIEKIVTQESARDPRFEDQVELRFTSSHVIQADGELLEALFTSALADSFGRMEEHSAVTVEIESESDSTFNITLSYPGQPLSKEQVRAAFEPFGSPDEVLFNRGDGMSLAIVKEIATLHGGKAGMTSRNGDTIIVSISLPIGQASQGTEDLVSFPFKALAKL